MRRVTTRRSARREIVAIAVGLAATAVVGASAAGLGGLGSDQLGADTGSVAGCDSDGIDVEYRPVFHRPTQTYRVNRVVLNDVSVDCIGRPWSVTVSEAGPGGASSTDEGPALVLTGIRDTDPGPGVSLSGTARARVRLVASDVGTVSVVIGGRTVAP